MNIALIFAGGTGQRMNVSSKPKQFLDLYGKPILIYTLEHFQKNKKIDAIVLVCIKSWISYAKKLIEKYKITKISTIVSGGKTGQESIYKGLLKVYKQDPNSIVLIHDGVRPLIDDNTISTVINGTQKKGNCITVSPAIETIMLKNDNNQTTKLFDRKNCLLARAPQAFYTKDILKAHKQAKKEKLEFIDSASLMQYCGYKLHTIIGPVENIKITTPIDFCLFRALVEAKENSQVFS